MSQVQCPLCTEGRMFLTELQSKNTAMENKSYMWICEDCPGILLEWWDSADTDAFVKYLHGPRDHIIKQWEPPEETSNKDSKHLLKEE
jgi:hypothetical protein